MDYIVEVKTLSNTATDEPMKEETIGRFWVTREFVEEVQNHILLHALGRRLLTILTKNVGKV
jgi:hypothetical protein